MIDKEQKPEEEKAVIKKEDNEKGEESGEKKPDEKWGANFPTWRGIGKGIFL